METYNIPEFRFPILLKKIDKLNRRAKKIGCPPITINELGHSTAEVDEVISQDGQTLLQIPRKYKVVKISINGQAPKYAGWALLGIIDHREKGNLIRSIPGCEIPTKYRATNSICDHCQYKRNRKQTFVCQHDTGKYMQVGSTCIRDFLGHESPEWIARRCELLAEIKESLSSDSEGVPCSEYLFPIKDILLLAAIAVNNHGWVSKSKAGEDFGLTPTSSTVSNYLFDPKIKIPKPAEVDKELARDALIWAQNLKDETGDLNDYKYNVRTLANMNEIKIQDLGLAVSIVGVYQNQKNKEIERTQKEKAESQSEHFGNVKDRLDLEVKILYQNTWETQYGYTTMYKMITNFENLCVWFSSRDLDLENDHTYKIKGTIKNHSEYREKKETVLTRVKIIKEI